VDSQFGSLPGVVRTTVGYTGGSTENPSYYKLDDHIESVQVEYDPVRISYEELLEVFWADPAHAYPPYARQYMPAVFYHDGEQERLALQGKERAVAETGGVIYTEVLPAKTFYPAEDYHQKYWLRHRRDFMEEFRGMYAADGDIVASTAAARVNGYVAGYGTPETLEAELDGLGFSEPARQALRELVERNARRQAALND
jgi:methionine-S-sulfoxide reductase